MDSKLKIKVCGLRCPHNIKEIDQLGVDFVGFIFHDESPRNMDKNFGAIPETTAVRVGVFVDKDIDYIIKKARNFRLNIIQLHGNEDPDTCAELRELGYFTAKAIQVDESTTVEEIEPYLGSVDLFLYDTKSPEKGGSGIKFNWQRLEELAPVGPFVLSGGIGPEDAEAIKNMTYENLLGVDINSRFEKEPGIKDIELVKAFVATVRD